MDPFTHTMAGAVMARVGGSRKTPLAGATMMLGANAPDIDIVTLFTGSSYASIAFRRGWTHGPIFLALLPLIITAVITGWDRYVRRRRDPSKAPVDARWTFVLAVIATLSHPVLDWLNTYGIRLMMPFSGTWYSGDSVFIIDPYWWVLLGGTLVLARRGASLRTVRRTAAVAFAYPFVLIGISTVGDRVAIVAAAGQGIPEVREVIYQPLPANPFAAQLIAVTPMGYHLGELRWLRHPRAVYDGGVIPIGNWEDSRIGLARASNADVRDFLVWARYPWVRIDTTAADDSDTVVFGDARFPEGGFAGGLGGIRVKLPRGDATGG
jgi:inner membrane protein